MPYTYFSFLRGLAIGSAATADNLTIESAT
jgi:hypothetical protein